MAGTLSVQKIQGLASSATPTTVEVSNGHALHVNTLKGTTTAGSINVQGEGNAITNLQQGLCKAWIMQEDGTTVHDSLNQASLTDNGTGNYTITFTNNMNNAVFPVLQQMNPYTSTAGSKTVLNGSRANHSDGQATTHYIFKCGQVAIGSHGSAQDADCGAGIVGDLA